METGTFRSYKETSSAQEMHTSSSIHKSAPNSAFQDATSPTENTPTTIRKRRQVNKTKTRDEEHAEERRREHRSQRSIAATAIATTLTGIISYRMSEWLLLAFPYRELLCALSFLIAAIFFGISRMASARFYANDHYIDECESWTLTVLDVIVLLTAFLGVNYISGILTDLFMLTGLPIPPSFFASLGLFVVLALSFVPYIYKFVLSPRTVEDEDDLDSEFETMDDDNVEEEEDDDEDVDARQVALAYKITNVGRADD